MEYQYIVNPLTNRKCRADTVLGKRIIRKYIKAQNGGFFNKGKKSPTESHDDEVIKTIGDKLNQALSLIEDKTNLEVYLHPNASEAIIEKFKNDIHNHIKQIPVKISSNPLEDKIKKLESMLSGAFLNSNGDDVKRFVNASISDFNSYINFYYDEGFIYELQQLGYHITNIFDSIAHEIGYQLNDTAFINKIKKNKKIAIQFYKQINEAKMVDTSTVKSKRWDPWFNAPDNSMIKHMYSVENPEAIVKSVSDFDIDRYLEFIAKNIIDEKLNQIKKTTISDEMHNQAINYISRFIKKPQDQSYIEAIKNFMAKQLKTTPQAIEQNIRETWNMRQKQRGMQSQPRTPPPQMQSQPRGPPPQSHMQNTRQPRGPPPQSHMQNTRQPRGPPPQSQKSKEDLEREALSRRIMATARRENYDRSVNSAMSRRSYMGN